MSLSNQSLTALALRKFRKNFWGVFSFVFIAVLVFIAIFGYFITPDNSKYANWGDLAIRSKEPGFKVTMLRIPLEHQPESHWYDYFAGHPETAIQKPVNDYRTANDTLYFTEYSEDKSIVISDKIPLTAFGKGVDQKKIESQFITEKKFLLGTDNQGRDLLSRLIIGSRVSIAIGFVAVIISLVVGIFFGALAGYYGGKTDAFVMWLINVIWSIPTLLLVIAITLALGKGFWQVFVAVGLTMWVEVARVVRGQVMGIKEMQYVTAARALGYTNGRIIFHHILPNSMAPVIVISAANFASAILVESGLSFLGLGAQLPVPSWGAMIKDNYNYIILGKPYLAIIPGVAMLLMVLAFMMIGNALRDALDVKGT